MFLEEKAEGERHEWPTWVKFRSEPLLFVMEFRPFATRANYVVMPREK